MKLVTIVRLAIVCLVSIVSAVYINPSLLPTTFLPHHLPSYFTLPYLSKTTILHFPRQPPNMPGRIDFNVELQLRVATLEAENHLIKAQLAQSLTGSAYIMELAAAEHQMQDERHQLEHENKRLRNNINAGLKEETRILRAKLESAMKCNERLIDRLSSFNEENNILNAKLDSAMQCNDRLTNRLDASRHAAEVAQAQQERGRNESPVWFGSWAGSENHVAENEVGNDAATRKTVGAWITDYYWPSSTEDCKRDQTVDYLAKSEHSIGSNDAEAQSQPSMEGADSTPDGEQQSEKLASEKSITPWKSIESMNTVKKTAAAVQKLANSDEQDKKNQPSTPVADVIRIEATNGETFYIHSASSSPMDPLTSTEEASKHQLRREARSVQRSFRDHEHNRLAGAAAWIEDYSEEEYADYWVEYAAEHRDHSAGEWRQYYESKVRPAYVKKMAARSGSKAVEKESISGDGEKDSRLIGQRKDSAFAGPNEGEVKSSVGPLIDLTAVQEEEETRSAHSAEMPAVAVARYHTFQLRECRAFAKSIQKNNKRLAPEEVNFTSLSAASEAASEVSIRSFKASDVKEIDVPARSVQQSIDEVVNREAK